MMENDSIRNHKCLEIVKYIVSINTNIISSFIVHTDIKLNEIITSIKTIESNFTFKLLSPIPQANINLCIQKKLTLLLIEWISKKAISFAAIFDTTFRSFLTIINPHYHLVSQKKFIELIHEYANSLSLSWGASDHTAYGSLFDDGAHKCQRDFICVMLFTEGKLHFIDLLQLENQKSISIVEALKPIVESLKEMKIIITGYCSDNAPNEIAVINSKKQSTLQSITGLPMLHIACCAHTIVLGAKDFLANGISEDFLENLKKINSTLKIEYKNSNFYNMPRIIEHRWYGFRE